jgi:chromosome segregation ATPase
VTVKPKGAPEKGNDDSLDSIFDVLEKRIEGLSAAQRDLAATNEKLKAGLAAATAERDRLKTDLKAAQEASAEHGQTAARAARYEAERENVRARIERLVKSLEGQEASSGKA